MQCTWIILKPSPQPRGCGRNVFHETGPWCQKHWGSCSNLPLSDLPVSVGWIPPPSPNGDGLSRQCLFLPGVRRVQSGPTLALPSSQRENQHVALQTLTRFLSQSLLPLILPCPVKSLVGATWMVAFFHQQEARLHVLVPGVRRFCVWPTGVPASGAVQCWCESS